MRSAPAARDVRRIFAAESVALAVGGWLLGIPVGWALDHLLVWLVKEQLNVVVPFTFPLANVAWALVGTVVLALVITFFPIPLHHVRPWPRGSLPPPVHSRSPPRCPGSPR